VTKSKSETPSDTIGADIERRAWAKSRQLGVLALVTGAIIVVVAGIWIGGRYFGSTPGTASKSPAPAGTFRPTAEQFKTLSVQTVAVSQFQGTEVTDGRIALNGDLVTPVFSPYSGRITHVIARPGDVLKRGATLATIDATEFVQAQNDLAAAVAQTKLARANESRKHGLYDAKGGSLQDWQQSQADLATAEVALKAVRNRLRILGKSDAQIEALESSEHMDATATIDAPINGVVVDRQVGPGQYVQSGSGNPVFTLADVSSVWLVGNVREDDAPLMRKGLAVEVSVNAFPGRTFKARLIYVAATVDPNTHRLPVRAEIANPDGALKPEMFASFRIVTSEGGESPAVPEDAVVYDGTDAHVWVVQNDANGPVIGIRPIKVGRTDARTVQVLDGLKIGEQVVTRGSLFIDRAVTGD
jgi:cobalt-zinc-cadmium efflux system membrane fusion protein